MCRVRGPISACRCGKSANPIRMQAWERNQTHPFLFTILPGLIQISEVKVDIRSGLPPLREKWIEERNDTEILAGPGFSLW